MERPTHAGKLIMDESFRLIDQELGPLDLPPWAAAVVRRMIHASADFDFAKNIRFHSRFETAFSEGIRRRLPIVTDVEMVRIAIQTQLQNAGLPAYCFVGEEETRILAEKEGLTRCAATMRIAQQRFPEPLLVIGNAPTALEEALNLVHEGRWRPMAIIAIPVGFVGVVEAKKRLLGHDLVPFLTCVCRKGGSAVTAAAVNALLEWSADDLRARKLMGRNAQSSETHCSRPHGSTA